MDSRSGYILTAIRVNPRWFLTIQYFNDKYEFYDSMK